jgi:hypothetical protein
MAFSQFEAELRGSTPLVEPSAYIQRTLVVGLGGTGGEVIKRLKRRLGRQPSSTHIRFLSLDTDVRTWLATLQFPALEPRERVPLYYATPEHVLESPHLYPTVQHLCHLGRRVDISLLADANGAGLMPAVGRVAFHLNAGQVHAALQRALRDLQAMPAQLGGQPLTDEYRIYVVGSVAGGTGAGSIIDTAVLIRHVFKRFKYQLIGVLALPEAFAPTLRGQQLDAQSRGNAYAVLKELQYLQDGPVHWSDPETYSFAFQLGSDVRTVTLQERPFHILYVVDNQNQHGGALRHLTDIYEMIAQQLSVEIGSPFGAKFASAQANDRAIMGLAPCPESGRPANISSLATAALVVPAEKLLRYCLRRYLRELLQERLLGRPDAGRQAAAWLLAAGYEERGNHRQISRALLTDPREGREWTGAEHALAEEGWADRPVDGFLSGWSAQAGHFAGQVLPAVRMLIERNAERLRSAMPLQVSAWLEEAFGTGGLRGALAARRALDQELQEAVAELTARQHEDEAIRDDLAAQVAAETETLEGRRGVFGGLFGRRRESMRLLCRLQADQMQLSLDMAARAGALRLLEGLRATLEEQRRRLEALESHLQRLDQTVEAELIQGEGGDLATYALETEVIRPADYPLYYQRFRPPSPEGLLARLGGGQGLPAALLDLEYDHLAARLYGEARALFQEPVCGLNVVDVLQERFSRQAAFDLLDDLAKRCQPFWTASPRGAGAFSDVFLIGSPGVCPGGPGTAVQAEPLLQEWVEQHAGGGVGGLQSAPTYVAMGAPGAIIFSRQTHGARLHYMRQILDYQEHYRALQQQRGYPLHFKPCLEALPELRPDDEKATECWALAVAYGMAACKTFGWVWALEGGTLCTGSLWDLAAEIVPVESREVLPHSNRFLHQSRAGAMGQFSQRREWVIRVEQMVNQRLDALGKQVVGAELGRYLEEVLMSRMKRTEELDAISLTRESGALRRFLDRLNL